MKKYEENRKARKFNVKWLTNREWLDHNESNDIMTCKICTKHSSRQTSSNLTNTNKFLTGCTNFRISTIEDHETSAMHRNLDQIYGKDDDDDFCEDWHDVVENWAYIYEYARE